MALFDYINAWLGEQGKTGRYNKVVQQVDGLWMYFCKWQSALAVNQDELKARVELQVAIDTFPWKTFYRVCNGKSSSNPKDNPLAAYEHAISAIRDRLSSGTLPEHSRSNYQTCHLRVVDILAEQANRMSLLTKFIGGAALIVVLFLVGYHSYNLYAIGIASEKVETARPRLGYQADQKQIPTFSSTAEYKNMFLTDFNRYFFSSGNDGSGFMANYLKNRKYEVSFKVRLRNRSSTNPLFISSVGARVKQIEPGKFPWKDLAVEPGIEIMKNKTYFILKTKSLAPIINLKIRLETIEGRFLEEIEKKNLNNGYSLNINAKASHGEWRYLAEKNGQLASPVTFWYSEKNGELPPTDKDIQQKNPVMVVECTKPMFKLKEPWHLLEDLREKGIGNWDLNSLFSRETVLKLKGVKVSEVPIREFLKTVEPNKEEFIEYLNCFSKEGKFEIIRTKARLADFSEMIETRGVKFTYAYEGLNGAGYEGEETLEFDEPLTYFRWKIEPGKGPGKEEYTGGYPKAASMGKGALSLGEAFESKARIRSIADTTAGLVSKNGISKLKGESIISTPLTIELNDKSETESWIEIDKVLDPGGFVVITLSLLSPGTAKYGVQVFVNDKRKETFQVNTFAPDVLKFGDAELETWLQRFR